MRNLVRPMAAIATILLCSVILLQVSRVEADTSGPRSVSSVSDCVNATGIGTVTWGSGTGPGTPSEAMSSNNIYADVGLGGNTQSNFLKCTNFGFNDSNLPDTATINGIVVGVEKHASGSGITDNAARVVKGGVVNGTNVTGMPTTAWSTSANLTAPAPDSAYTLYGSSTDVNAWNAGGWTPTDVHNSGFGFALSARRGSGGGSVVAAVDHIRVTIHYTPAAGGVTVSAPVPNQTATVSIPSTGAYIGKFIITGNTGATVNVSGITISERGTVDGQTGLDNIKLFYDVDSTSPYDCAADAYAPSDLQFGSTDTDGFNGANGDSAFSGSVDTTNTRAICVYFVLDVTSSPADGQTIEIEVTSMTISSGSVTPALPLVIPGTTTLSLTSVANEVKFKIALSNCSNGATNYPTCTTGTWNSALTCSGSDTCFVGPNCAVGDSGDADWYVMSPATAKNINLTCWGTSRTFRYVRYKVEIEGSTGPPNITEVRINYASQ